MSSAPSSQFANSVSRRFSAAASTYHAKSYVQPLVAARLLDLLPREMVPSRILELGCGSGHLTRGLRERWPDVRVEAIDTAPGMIEFCRRHFVNDALLQFEVADAARLSAKQAYALIISNCALHWLEQPGAAFANLALSLARDGRLAFSLMLDETLWEVREARLHAAPGKPPLGRLPTLAETLGALRGAGFDVIHAAEETVMSTAPSGAALLRTLHEHGVTGGRVSQAVLPLNRQELTELARYYDDHFALPDGSVRASYRVGYVVATRR
jgi:malonyl-ACP O-methyltransferase BioC